jgi:hypothetical protein
LNQVVPKQRLGNHDQLAPLAGEGQGEGIIFPSP